MRTRRQSALAVLLATIVAVLVPALAQDRCADKAGRGGTGRKGRGATGALLALKDTPQPPDITWLATWRQALEEAQLTRRPILLVFASPRCVGVPGAW